MSNSFLTKKFLINNNKKKNHDLIKDNKINTNNKLKVIKKKSLDKHGNILHGNTKQWLAPHKLVPTYKNTWPVTTYTCEQNFQTNQ
jgi:hypothetical protein